MKLDYYLNQAIEEYKRENEEEEEEEDNENENYDDNDLKKNDESNINRSSSNNNINQVIRRSKEKEKGISAQNMILLRNERNKKNKVRRQSQFVEQLQFDFNELRNKFSRDEEI